MSQPTEFPSPHEALLHAAERLFAISEFNVPIRQITQAAGARNTSAVHYHFGSREALITEVLRSRYRQVDPRREAMLEKLDAENRSYDIRGLVEAWVRPLAGELEPRPEGNYYLRFLERAAREVGQRESIIVPTEFLSAYLETERRIAVCISFLPEKLAKLRVLMAREQLTAALAAMEGWLEQGSVDVDDLPLMVDALIDALVGQLNAPLSPRILERVLQEKGASEPTAR